MKPEAREAWEAARSGHDLPHSTACVAPWVALEFDPSGWVYACCANQTYPIGRIDEQRLPELWGGARMGVLRDALRRWDLSVGCQSCRWHFEHGRMDPDAAVYEGYPVHEADPAGPMAMTFALSNRCNLGCVMCNPALSSVLRHQAGLPSLVPVYGDEFFADLAAFLPRLRYAKFLGGEPFLIPEHQRVWDLMDEVGGPPRIQVTTNGTVWTDRVAWVLDRFTVDITVSIDAARTDTYESIRRGARHADVLANIERFRAACRASGAELRFCMCLMDNNWRELGEFLSWADELDVPVSINVVSDDGLALHDLPLEQLDEVARTWAAEDAVLGHQLRRNAEVWRTQLTQLDAVRAERAAGVPAPSKQPRPTTAALFDPLVVGGEAVRQDSVEDHRVRLDAWSGGGEVAVLELGPDRTITRLVAPHARLGLIAAAVLGRPVGDVIDIIGHADGRPIWVLDVEDLGDHVVRMMCLSTNTMRGNPGSVVRTVEVRATRDLPATVLIAEDRILDHIHDRPNMVPIPAPTRRPQ